MAEQAITSTSEDIRSRPELCIDISVKLAATHEALKRIEASVRKLELRAFRVGRSEQYKDLVIEAQSTCSCGRLKITELANENIYKYSVNFPHPN